MSFRAPNDPRHALGRRAEALVAEHLEERGFRVLERNARVGSLEIDLVAQRGRLLVFCEVRARRAGGLMHPLETIGPTKVRRMREAATRWAVAHRTRGLAMRIDVAAVTFDGATPTLDYVEDAV